MTQKQIVSQLQDIITYSQMAEKAAKGLLDSMEGDKAKEKKSPKKPLSDTVLAAVLAKRRQSLNKKKP